MSERGDRLREAARRLLDELKVYRAALHHPKTPRSAKIFLGLAVGYALLPFDLIPDVIPLVGHLDDAVIVPILFLAGVRRIPPGVIDECRQRLREAKIVVGPSPHGERAA